MCTSYWPTVLTFSPPSELQFFRPRGAASSGPTHHRAPCAGQSADLGVPGPVWRTGRSEKGLTVREPLPLWLQDPVPEELAAEEQSRRVRAALLCQSELRGSEGHRWTPRWVLLLLWPAGLHRWDLQHSAGSSAVLRHRSDAVELETGQVVHLHPVHTRQARGALGRLSALTEAQTQKEVAHHTVWSQWGHDFFWLYRGTRKASYQHGATATSSGYVAQEAQNKDKGDLSDLCLFQELCILKKTLRVIEVRPVTRQHNGFISFLFIFCSKLVLLLNLTV